MGCPGPKDWQLSPLTPGTCSLSPTAWAPWRGGRLAQSWPPRTCASLVRPWAWLWAPGQQKAGKRHPSTPERMGDGRLLLPQEGSPTPMPSVTAPLERDGGLAMAEGPWPFKRFDSALRVCAPQTGYKVTLKKVHSVPQARQGRASCQSTQLLTLGAPGNFLFVGGAGWATGHKLWAR